MRSIEIGLVEVPYALQCQFVWELHSKLNCIPYKSIAFKVKLPYNVEKVGHLNSWILLIFLPSLYLLVSYAITKSYNLECITLKKGQWTSQKDVSKVDIHSSSISLVSIEPNWIWKHSITNINRNKPYEIVNWINSAFRLNTNDRDFKSRLYPWKV